MHTKIHRIGNIGTIFRATIQVDIGDLSTATRMEFHVLKPDGTTVTWTAAWTTNGTDNKMEYKTLTANDLDQKGDWQLEGYAETPDGKWTTADRYKFKVDKVIVTV